MEMKFKIFIYNLIDINDIIKPKKKKRTFNIIIIIHGP